MKTLWIGAIVLCAALFAVVLRQRNTIRELESRLQQSGAGNAPSEPAQQIAAAQLAPSSTAVYDSALTTSEQRREGPDAEVLRLRGLAARAIRAEAELAQIQAAKPTSSPVAASSSQQGSSQSITTYLGQPIPSPENLPEAYQRQGLLNVVQAAAQGAGITLKKVEIDTSEFPYLIGVVANGIDDFEKLKAWIKQNDQYEYNGGVSTRDRYAFNITPSRFNPPESSQRIHARTLLRENMLFDSLNK